MPFKKYTSEIESKIIENPFVINYNFQFNQLSPNTAILEIQLLLQDGSQLVIFEFLRLSDGEVSRQKYRYHCMSAIKEMIFRYDNAPHHVEIESFPDHKHVGDNVMKSSAPRIIEVIHEIELLILKISSN